jgi:RNA polymerase sigma-70 factor (ECF subfamily)
LSSSDDLSQLMRLARRGDEEAYRRLLGRVATWLRSVARRGLARAGRSTEDSEDIVQETLLVMHLKRASWDDSQPLEPWLHAIARHKLIDHLRRRGFHDYVDIDEHAGMLAAPQPAEAGASADAIEGRSARDVGHRLGMSEGAVRVALHRALKALAAAYREHQP